MSEAPPLPPGGPTPTTHEMARAEAKAIAAAAVSGDRPDAEAFTVQLQPRHAAYLRARSEACGETPERHLETILRSFWATDPWRQEDQRPVGRGQPAGTGRR